MKKLATLLILQLALTADAQVKISGIAKNFNDSIFFINETGGFNSFTRAWRDNRVKISIEKDGHFKATLPEKEINTWYIKTGKGYQFFDLVAGTSLELIADFSRPNPLMAIGNNADDFNYTRYSGDSISRYYADNNLKEKTRSKSIDSTLLYRKKYAEFKLAVLNNYKKTHNISDTYYSWLKSKYRYEPYERTLVENITNRDSVDETTIQKIVQRGNQDEYAALNTTEYNDLVDFYMQTLYKKKQKGEFSMADYFDFGAKSDLIKGNTKNVFLSRLMYWMRTAPDSQYMPLFKKYDRMVSNTKMKQTIIAARKDYKIPKTSELPNFTRAKSLEAVFSKYKGKVMYIDFWASWCIPCRQEMPNAAVLKEKLKDKEVVFIYFGYKDKESAWTKARKQLSIEGIHYLLDEKMTKEAEEIFGINGIPHYAIIDKDGKIIKKRADRPSNVYQELLTLTEK